TPTRDVATSP
nr:Chain C, P21 activated Kinase peptide [synthetic construct]3DVP_D Chain D, P21 activated Kinase peptide [synthetic construct]